MIKIIINEDKERENINYMYIGGYCNSCNSKTVSNILSIRQDGGNNGTIINLCDKCLLELKKTLDDLYGKNGVR